MEKAVVGRKKGRSVPSRGLRRNRSIEREMRRQHDLRRGHSPMIRLSDKDDQYVVVPTMGSEAEFNQRRLNVCLVLLALAAVVGVLGHYTVDDKVSSHSIQLLKPKASRTFKKQQQEQPTTIKTVSTETTTSKTSAAPSDSSGSSSSHETMKKIKSSKIATEPPLHNVTKDELKAHPTLPPAKQLKVNYPVFVASFSKSGTTSTFYAFACYLGRDYVAHRWTTSLRTGGRPELIGRCIEQNVIRDAPPFYGCGTNYFNQTKTVVWTDTSYIGGDNGCYNPNVEALDAIWDAYPTATLLLVRRNATEWYHSANTRRAGFIPRWTNRCPHMPNSKNESVWVDFYNNYTQRVREFAQQRPAMTYVEVELEDPNAGQILEEKMGLPASCWKQCPSSFTQKGCQELNNNKTKNEGNDKPPRRYRRW